MRDIYITNSGTLSRKDNSLLFENEQQKRTVPIKDVDSIHAFSELNINSKLLNFLSEANIAVYFYNYYGFYTGTFSPRSFLLSRLGIILIQKKGLFYPKNLSQQAYIT